MKNFIKNISHKFITPNHSFTLIELLIVVVTILIFSGFSLAFYNRFTEEKKLEDEARKLVNVLELAKKKASASDVGNYSCNNFSGYRVSIQSTSYRFILCCSEDCNINYPIQNYNLSSNMQIISGLGNIQFKPLTTTANQSNITLKHTSISTCLNISINPAGVIDIGNRYSPC